MDQNSPILEFDPSRAAIIEPRGPKMFETLPVRGVLCFFQDVLDEYLGEGLLRPIGACASEIGTHPIYAHERSGQKIFVMQPGVGAPLSAGLLDELIAAGASHIIACGGCGVLDGEIKVGAPLILTSAVRDEGTSYHYLPPGREVEASPEAVQALEEACNRMNIPYRLAKTWTTDALYRETNARRALRVAEGCQVVEMEAAAFFAVAQFRGVTFGQVVYGGDLVVPEGWDDRGWDKHFQGRRLLLELAIEASLLL